MIIVNQSNENLTINGTTVCPVEEYKTDEMMFNTQAVFSNIGSIEIITEYGIRFFRCYGHLSAYEDTNLKDNNGLPIINVVCTTT